MFGPHGAPQQRCRTTEASQINNASETLLLEGRARMQTKSLALLGLKSVRENGEDPHLLRRFIHTKLSLRLHENSPVTGSWCDLAAIAANKLAGSRCLIPGAVYTEVTPSSTTVFPLQAARANIPGVNPG